MEPLTCRGAASHVRHSDLRPRRADCGGFRPCCRPSRTTDSTRQRCAHWWCTPPPEYGHGRRKPRWRNALVWSSSGV